MFPELFYLPRFFISRAILNVWRVQKRDDLYSSHSSRKVSTTLLKPNHQAGYLRHIT
jgi:hypothetical protein